MEWGEFKKMWNRAYWHFAGVWTLAWAAICGLIYVIYLIYNRLSSSNGENEE